MQIESPEQIQQSSRHHKDLQPRKTMPLFTKWVFVVENITFFLDKCFLVQTCMGGIFVILTNEHFKSAFV